MLCVVDVVDVVVVVAVVVANSVCQGMIGFPNVGKSSCINALLGITATTHTKKRVAVAAQPGRTKHFQTLELTDAVVLCDCPGLVFPSFMNSKVRVLCGVSFEEGE